MQTSSNIKYENIKNIVLVYIPANTPTGRTIKFVYRGDARGPEYIFRHGFSPKGNEANLLRHFYPTTGSIQYNFNPNSAWIGTSLSKDVAKYFPGTSAHRYVYEIDFPTDGIDLAPEVARSYQRGDIDSWSTVQPRQWRIAPCCYQD